ncbi:putative membrane protein ArfC [Microbacterium sp. Bi128]|nr:putative membrane protein ArfC [Microbacterium sp. Bi128]
MTAAELGAAAETGPAGLPVHHPEYTEPHAPTLPGAESAAAEPADDEDTVTGTATSTSTGAGTAIGTAMPGVPDAGTQPAGPADTETTQMAASPAGAEASASQTAEPTGHLATEQPYGEGSAAPAADGSGPEGFTVKGNASSMIYHDETSPAYEETRAEVWFASPAHAEAAGFRPPRRTRQ